MTARRYRGRWYVDFRYENRRIRRKSPVQTKRGTEEYERRLRDRLFDGKPLPGGRKGLDEIEEEERREMPSCRVFFTEWVEIYAVNNNRPSEVRTKRSIVRNHLCTFFGNVRIDRVGVRHIEQFKAKKLKEGLTPKTINNYMTVLRRALVSAMEWEYIKVVPQVKWMKTPPPSFDFLTRDESERLLKAVPPERYAHVLTALKAGLRSGELLALRWEDIDFHTEKILVRRSVWKGHETPPKNGKNREVPMSPHLSRTLKAHRHLRGPQVFCQESGQPLTRDMVKRVLPFACKKAGLRGIQFHALRHSFASQLVMEGVPLKVVQELLGHATIEMTMRYAHLAPSMHIDAVAKLDREEESGHYLGTKPK